MRLDGLENKEKQLNEWFFDRNPVSKQCLVSYLHLSNYNMLINCKNYQYSLIFSLKDGIKLPLSAKDRDNYLKSIKKFMQEFLEAEHCIVRGNIYGVDKINIVPCGSHCGQVVFFNEVFREEYKGCSDKIKKLLGLNKYKEQPDQYGFFEEKCWGLAIKPLGNNKYALRNNTEERAEYLPGASTCETEEDTIKAIITMQEIRKLKHIPNAQEFQAAVDVFNNMRK